MRENSWNLSTSSLLLEKMNFKIQWLLFLAWIYSLFIPAQESVTNAPDNWKPHNRNRTEIEKKSPLNSTHLYVLKHKRLRQNPVECGKNKGPSELVWNRERFQVMGFIWLYLSKGLWLMLGSLEDNLFSVKPWWIVFSSEVLSLCTASLSIHCCLNGCPTFTVRN